jgi:hypothetical protein
VGHFCVEINTMRYLQFELRTVRAVLGAQPVVAMQAVATRPGADLLFSSGTEQRRASNFAPPSSAKKLWMTSSLNSVLYFFMKPLEVRPTSGGQFKAGAVHSCQVLL